MMQRLAYWTGKPEMWVRFPAAIDHFFMIQVYIAYCHEKDDK